MHRHLENVRVSLFAALDAQEADEGRITTPGSNHRTRASKDAGK
jgi:hypothetical protein